MSDQPWSPERIRAELAVPSLVERFDSECDEAPEHRRLVVRSKWQRVAQSLDRAFEGATEAHRAAVSGEGGPFEDITDRVLDEARQIRSRAAGDEFR